MKMTASELIALINRILVILSGMTFEEGVSWVEVQENAARLRSEGHESGPPETPAEWHV